MKIGIGGHAQVVAGVSERSDGSMVWWNRKPVDPMVRKNRDAFFVRNGIEPNRVVSGGLVHGNTVAVVGDAQAGEYLLNTDGLITNVPNLFLAVTVADCLPLFFFDPKTHAIGIAHAGWRGIVGGMPEKVVSEMARAFGSHPKDLVVVIGPHIQQHHYVVGGDVAQAFDSRHVQNDYGNVFVDLGGEAKSRLETSGVQEITVDQTCTYCSADRLFSARHDKSEPLQGAVAFIGLATL